MERKVQYKHTLRKEIQGKILDIGGGGEGIIGRLYGCQVTAIDNRQEELLEAPEGFEKVLMDAANLTYGDFSYDHVTFFYTLMYMTGEEQAQAIREAARVLKPGGRLHIWDCEIASAYPEPFCVDLEIKLPDETIYTTYGIGKMDGQSCGSLGDLCTEAGLKWIEKKEHRGHYYLIFEKSKYNPKLQ